MKQIRQRSTLTRVAHSVALTLVCLSGGSTHAQNTKLDVPKVETYYGLWRDVDGRPIFFERRGIDDPSSNKFVNGKTLVKGQKEARLWTGHYNDGKLHLSYRPSAEEINAKLPEWVRKEAFKQVLRWRLEVAAVPACGAENTIDVKWFPGEVHWEEGKPDSVKIVGEGKPIEIKYKRDLEIEAEFTAAASMGIYAKDGGWVDSPDVKYVTHDDRFRVDVLLPRALAEKQGGRLALRFTSTLSGKSMEIELTAAPAERLAAVRYTRADSIKVEELGRIFAAKNGDFRGEPIIVSFGDVSRHMRVFATEEARSLFRIHEALAEHEAIWLSHLQSPTLSREEKENAQQRLRLVRNARTLADADTFYTYRLSMVSQYLSEDGLRGLVLAEKLRWIHDARVGHNAKIELLNGSVWDLGYGWAAEEEQTNVTGAYRFAANRMQTEAIKATIFGVYDFVATSTGGDKIVMLLFGIDHRGKRVATVDRVGAIGRFFVPDPENPLDWIKFARGASSFASAARRLGEVTKFTEVVGRLRPGALPPGVSGRVRHTMRPATGANTPLTCLGTLGPSRPIPGRAHENYPESFKLLPGGAMPQHGQVEERGCVLASFAHEHAYRRGVELDQHGLRKYLELHRIEQHKRYAGLAAERGLLWEEGDPLVHATGAVAAPHNLTPFEIEFYQDKTEWSVILSMSPKPGIRHAVVLKLLERDGDGKIKRVVFFDPDVINPATGKKGHLVYTDKPCDFWNAVAKYDNAWLVKWESSK